MKKSSLTKTIVAALIVIAATISGWKVAVRPDKTGPAVDAVASPTVALLNTSSREISKAPHTSWQAELAGLEKSQAVSWLNAKLDSGDNAATGDGFVPGTDGRLAQAPTLRVAWLEELGRRDPAAAAAQSEKILSTPTTTEEWATAIRWLAVGRPEARELLEEKVRTLLLNEAWRRHPTVAWLEAFDAAAWLGGTSLLPELTGLAREKENRPASHAAFLALDRVVQTDTAAVLAALQADPALLQTREEMRGNLFARADVSDASQRHTLEEYLLAPDRTPMEIQAFADVFPNGNYYLSANLLTHSRPPNPAEQRTRDQAALGVVRAWRKDTRFASRDLDLARIEARLVEFTAMR